MVVVRWNRIARPSQELLKAQIKALETETALLGSDAALGKISELLTAAAALINERTVPVPARLADLLFWSRGKELVGWGYVHEAEVQQAAYLAPETVRVRLEAAERELRASDGVAAISLANDIHNTPFESATLPRQKALLAEALSVNYDREDISFANLVAWQNKTSWIVYLGLLLIVVLAGIEPQRAILLLVGAVGGLLSRLSRSLERKDVPTDYGASWTTLFLSPIAGALGAWAGVLVTGLAAHFNVLDSETFKGLWSCPFAETSLAIALLFGFSERLLDTVLDKLVDETAAKPGSGPAQKPAQKPAQTPPGGAPSGGASPLPEAVPNHPYVTRLSAPGLAVGAVWEAVPADLPPGFSLTGDGTLTGTLVGEVADRPFYEFTAKVTSNGTERALRFRLPVGR